MISAAIPHCPTCKGKPTDGQRKLLPEDRNRLTGRVLEAVFQRFDTAYRCETCRTIYSFSDGFSMTIGKFPA